jgi:hypothetical protein
MMESRESDAARDDSRVSVGSVRLSDIGVRGLQKAGGPFHCFSSAAHSLVCTHFRPYFSLVLATLLTLIMLASPARS